jgi:hypothetical protein
MTPCIGISSAIAIPCEENVYKNHADYVLFYLSRVLRLREKNKGDFWLPRDTKLIHEWLQLFTWTEKSMPVVPRDKDVAVFAEKITFTTPRTQIYKEDIETLRKYFKTYTTPNHKRVVILQDDILLTTQIVSYLEKSLESQGYEVDVVFPKRSTPSTLCESIVGCQYCISGPLCNNLFWLLPSGSRVIDCMPEVSIEGKGAQMAGACGLDYWVLLLPRGKPEIIAKLCAEKVIASMQKQNLTVTKSKIILPKNQTGFHSHKGDSFREMVKLWEERGYVSIEYADTPYVWLNSIGDTILYDRANFSWLGQTSYKKILCGNPDPANVPNGVKWSFWPRHPKIVEELAEVLLTNERIKTLVFYGAAENHVQKAHRSNRLCEACDDFSLTDGSSYKFDQRDYLYALSQSKFGLCLAGFGPKCNREIECMAVGTVPVVAPDVDMDNYMNPPKEGVHYIRLKSFDPEEARNAVNINSWEEMSKAAHEWWKANSSAKGLWAITRE